MTEKQRFLVYVHFAGLIASIRKSGNVSISEAIRIMLERGIIEKLEDLETGYYLESDGYLEERFLLQH
ncbi:hypothetical protein R83H12_03179 [Fibrobacteria bacterium R8-3-H12]